MNSAVAIAAVEAEDAARALAGEPLEARLRAAMHAVANHWMARTDNEQFEAAMEGCARAASAEERVRLNAEIRRVNLLLVALSGVPLDADAVIAEQKNAQEPLGSLALWREAKGLTGEARA